MICLAIFNATFTPNNTANQAISSWINKPGMNGQLWTIDQGNLIFVFKDSRILIKRAKMEILGFPGIRESADGALFISANWDLGPSGTEYIPIPFTRFGVWEDINYFTKYARNTTALALNVNSLNLNMKVDSRNVQAAYSGLQSISANIYLDIDMYGGTM